MFSNTNAFKPSGLRRPAAITLVTLALGGCASFSPDAGLAPAQSYASAEFNKDLVKITDEGIATAAQARVEQLLRQPLTAASAVQIALLKNRGLQATFNELGVSEAQFVQATLPPVPRVSLSSASGDMTLEIARSVVGSIIELATLKVRAAIAERRFASAQYRAAAAVVQLATDAERQYFIAVAANQSVGFLEQALASAESASVLAKALGETGALNKLEQAREHAFYVELGAQLAKARVQQRVEREKLIRQLGLWGRDIDFKLPGSLPPLPPRLLPGQTLEAQAMDRRADLRMARLDFDALAVQYGLTSTTGFISVFDLGYTETLDRTTVVTPNEGGAATVSRDRTLRRGISADLTIPIYDFGRTSVRGAQEAYLGAANRLAQRAVNARSEVREAYLRYRGNFDLARHYQSTVLPIRKIIQDQALLQYSGMLIDVTQLIIDARSRILSNIQAIEARRDFWIAATDLKAALTGGVAPDAGAGAPAGSSIAAATPG